MLRRFASVVGACLVAACLAPACSEEQTDAAGGSSRGDTSGERPGECEHGTMCEAVAATCERGCTQDCSDCGADPGCIDNCVALELTCEEGCALDQAACERDAEQGADGGACAECIEHVDCESSEECFEGMCLGAMTSPAGSGTSGGEPSTDSGGGVAGGTEADDVSTGGSDLSTDSGGGIAGGTDSGGADETTIGVFTSPATAGDTGDT